MDTHELDNLFAAGYTYVDAARLSEASHFELRPVCDGSEYTMTTYFYGEDTNKVQISMGLPGKPTELIAVYDFDESADACNDFFALAYYCNSLWYNGNDLLTKVVDKVDLAKQIVEERFTSEDEEFDELTENLGLSEEERHRVCAFLDQSNDRTNDTTD